MALITRYVGTGVGADFEEWRAAWQWLHTLYVLNMLLDDHIFIQVADVLMNVGGAWDDYDLRMNGHYVWIWCPWADSHQGDTTRGFRTYIDANIQGIFMTARSGFNPGGGALLCQGLSCERVGHNAGAETMVFITGGDNDGGHWNIARNLILRGYNQIPRRDYLLTVGNNSWSHAYASDCKLFHGTRGFGSSAWTGSPLYEPDRYVERVNVYDCNAGYYLGRSNFGYRFRDCIATDIVTNCWGGGVGWEVGNDFDSCADDDNTLTVGTGTRHIVNSANEYQSLDPDNSNFLKPVFGVVSYNG